MRLRSLFIRSREERRAYVERKIGQYVDEEVASRKWGVSYSIFDGEELLEASIRSIREEVDYVNVVYQTQSWYGNPASADLLPLLQKLRAEGLVEELIEYTPRVEMKPSKQETAKRNLGLVAARKAGVHYFMPMDCDEFYERAALQAAKRYIVRHQIDYAYCPIINYGSKPTQRLLSSSYFVQFFSRIGRFSELRVNQKCIALVDPTRQLGYPLFGCRQFCLNNVAMHHMSLIRKDIRKKVENSSFASYFEKNPLRLEFEEGQYVPCGNLFNIDTSAW